MIVIRPAKIIYNYSPDIKIIIASFTSRMYTVLDHYNPHSTNSEQEWDGLRSSKFGRTKLFLPHRDTISTGTSFI